MATGGEDSREDIVSSLISLSETICEKAMELQESDEPKDLVKRGRKLQKKIKSAGSKKSEPPCRTRNDVQIACCEMEAGRRGHTMCSPLYDVGLKKTDSYTTVLSKMCEAIRVPETEELKLFSARGAIISNDPIKIHDEEVPWTLGSYLAKRHAAPDKITLGVGSLLEDFAPSKEKKKKGGIKEASTSKHCDSPKVKNKKRAIKEGVASPPPAAVKYPAEAKTDDIIKVYYAEEDNMIPFAREDVWKAINGAPSGMDKIDIFHPEVFNYRVIQIVFFQNDMTEIPILQPDAFGAIVPCQSHGDSPLCFSSCKNPVLTSLVHPVPLVTLCRAHPYCDYKWECLSKPSMEFPSTPVIYIRNPMIFKCTILMGSRSLCSIHFDASYQPVTEVSSDQDIELQCHYDEPFSCEEVSILPPSFDSLQFGMDEILVATNHLSKTNELGKGGYGCVFLARDLRCNGTNAAVKVLTKEGSQALIRSSPSKQIEAELKALMKFRHPNILEIMGYCFTEQLKALVYKYMENGLLHTWIHTSSSKLTWERKVSLLKDVLRGIAYLHEGSPPVIHQDIKSQNVLLDSHFNAVVGDFGFAMELPQSVSGRTMVTAPFIARTEGYFPPELMAGKISPLCDVYSYGVLVLETYSALKPFCKQRVDQELAIHTEDYRSDPVKFKELADSSISEINAFLSETFRRVANSCIKRYSKRPTAKEALLLWESSNQM